MDWKNDFLSSHLTQENTLPELTLAYLPSWGIISAQGVDARSYLQGQLTCDISHLSKKNVLFSGHCDAKGKIWSIFRIFHHDNGYAMLQPKSIIDIELQELKKYAVFSKLTLNESEDVIFSILGSQANNYIHSISSDDGAVRSIEGGSAIKVADNRWAIVINKSYAPNFTHQFEGLKCSEKAWLLAEITDGIPVLNHHEQNTHIPQAINLQALNGISFTKGCYSGQETVARAKYRGTNKRALYTMTGPLKESTHPVEIERSVGNNWRSVGNLMSFHSFDDGTAIGQIVLPNNLDENTKFRVKDQKNQFWTPIPLPYSLDDTE